MYIMHKMPKYKINQIWNIILAEYKNHEVDSINYYGITSIIHRHFKMSDVTCNKCLYSTGHSGLQSQQH
jgi:hypothetical protein